MSELWTAAAAADPDTQNKAAFIHTAMYIGSLSLCQDVKIRFQTELLSLLKSSNITIIHLF